MLDMTQGVCALCSHNNVIQSWPSGGGATDNIAADEAQVGFLGASTQQRGELAAYICQKCGFVMWFANNAKDIPIGEKYHTQLIEGPAQS